MLTLDSVCEYQRDLSLPVALALLQKSGFQLFCSCPKVIIFMIKNEVMHYSIFQHTEYLSNMFPLSNPLLVVAGCGG